MAEVAWTPDGGQLHPRRVLTRLSRDLGAAEAGLVGGVVRSDVVAGADLRAPVRDSALRAELLYRAPEEASFFKFTLNVDSNLPGNIYALVEYHHNGDGHRHTREYDRDRLLHGEIAQFGSCSKINVPKWQHFLYCHYDKFITDSHGSAEV